MDHILEIRKAYFLSVKRNVMKLFLIETCFILLYIKLIAKSVHDLEMEVKPRQV